VGLKLLFKDVDIFDYHEVDAYFSEHYPRLASVLGNFRLMKAVEMQNILDGLDPGVQITFHAFPGQQLSGNAYAFPRFLRVEGTERTDEQAFRVTREKAIRDRLPAIMLKEEVVEYYFELADISFLQAEEEIRWAAKWPPEARFGRR